MEPQAILAQREPAHASAVPLVVGKLSEHHGAALRELAVMQCRCCCAAKYDVVGVPGLVSMAARHIRCRAESLTSTIILIICLPMQDAHTLVDGVFLMHRGNGGFPALCSLAPWLKVDAVLLYVKIAPREIAQCRARQP